MKLLMEEVKRVFKSLIFLGLAIALIIAISGQIDRESYEFKEPDINQETYGNYITDDPNYIFSNLIYDLYRSVETNSFTTYPYGFYREKSLESDELNAIKDIVSDLVSIPYDDIDLHNDISAPKKEKLENQLDKIDALIGGGSFYAKDMYQVHFGNKGMTYDQALKDFHLMQKSGYDLVFARYFSDYAGIFTLLMSWFIGLYFWNKDRKEGIASTIYVKEVSSFKIVMTRILAMSLALIFIVLAIFTYYEIKLFNIYGMRLLNPIKAYLLVFLWNFPIILFVVSISSFITTMTNSILLGFLGPILSLVYMMSSSSNIFYNIGYGLLIRYNSIGNEAYFTSKIGVFLIGRFMWIGIGFLITIITGILYERRRRGYHAFKNNLSSKS